MSLGSPDIVTQIDVRLVVLLTGFKTGSRLARLRRPAADTLEWSIATLNTITTTVLLLSRKFEDSRRFRETPEIRTNPVKSHAGKMATLTQQNQSHPRHHRLLLLLLQNPYHL